MLCLGVITSQEPVLTVTHSKNRSIFDHSGELHKFMDWTMAEVCIEKGKILVPWMLPMVLYWAESGNCCEPFLSSFNRALNSTVAFSGTLI